MKATYPQFPEGFFFGTATAAFQVEGSPAADGKGASIWDTVTHTPGKISSEDSVGCADISPECACLPCRAGKGGEFRGETQNAKALLLFLPQIAEGHLGASRAEGVTRYGSWRKRQEPVGAEPQQDTH